MKITLIIPTYNAGSLWPNVLDAIKQQTIYPDKLIVIDSGSKDETVPLASDLKNISIPIRYKSYYAFYFVSSMCRLVLDSFATLYIPQAILV
ncbi:glycosyltransferase [Salmonella enterica]|nr:glycosyltransferase [Salmonella enterica]